MRKMLIFDMDGTIADLYGVENWLSMLRAEDTTPYEVAKPMYDMDTLAIILEALKGIGWKVVVVSWGSMTGSKEYNQRTRKAKIDWLERFGFPYDEVHVVKYGTPKQKFAVAETNVLIDDSEEVRNSFLKRHMADTQKIAVDANNNIIEYLVSLLVAE